MKKFIILATALVILIVGIVSLRVIGVGASKAYLKSHATQSLVTPSNDGRFKIVIFRYPQLKDVPEILGFGQGFVQLQDASGRVLAEKEAEDLARLNLFRWSSNKVNVADFAEWELPQ